MTLTATPPISTTARFPLAWTEADAPDLTGRTVVVTGATSGPGLLLTGHLAALGAHVVVAARDEAKATAARAELLARGTGTDLAERLEVRRLDLADQDSVRRFADDWLDTGRPLDVLVNHTGVAHQPDRLSPQGHESRLATHVLGPFALTGRLLPALRASEATGPGPRVVTVGSTLYRRVPGDDLDALHGTGHDAGGIAYLRTKAAMTAWARELDRRLVGDAGTGTIGGTTDSGAAVVRSLVAHPGTAATPTHPPVPSRVRALVTRLLTGRHARPADQGVLPLLYAATDPGAPADRLLGPGRTHDDRVHATRFVRAAADPAFARRLWAFAEDLTGVRYL
jgi:NAD(P)-dependent dehydrogenase (short-subunit alcohol dehydrogenase family)